MKNKPTIKSTVTYNEIIKPEIMVTVVLTVYKRTNFLKSAIASVLKQSFSSFQIIVADDSNSLAIKNICASFQDIRIKYRSNQFNLGVALNLKFAISEATGKYITILNDDDEFEENYLEEMMFHLENNKTTVACFCDHFIMDQQGMIDDGKSVENSKRWGRFFLTEGLVPDIKSLELNKQVLPIAIGTIFRKDLINYNHLYAEVAGAYDLWLGYLLVNLNENIYYIPKQLTRYRVHSEMETSRRAIDKNINMIFLYTKAIQLNLFENDKGVLYKKLGLAYFAVGKDHMWFNKTQLARSYYFTSFVIDLNIKSLLALILAYLPKSFRVKLKLSKK